MSAEPRKGKFVFITGGVVSGLGKGVTASSLGCLFKARGYRVTMQKFDPYLNIDPGTMNPNQHGEVFVTEDGAETDLDLGHYERFIDENLNKNSNVTTGKVYLTVINRERAGGYNGGTVQVVPHITDEIKRRIHVQNEDKHITIIEVGGTVGDIEGQPFLEAIRQFQHEVGRENAIIVHLTLVPYIAATQELKTKPSQMSVKQLQMIGLWPDILVCRSEKALTTPQRAKLALFCNVPEQNVLQNLDLATIYDVPTTLEDLGFGRVALEALHLPVDKPDLRVWQQMLDGLHKPSKTVKIALVGKYCDLHDSYISVVEAVRHAGMAHHVTAELKWINSETLSDANIAAELDAVDGILVPGGFGDRAIDGMILAIKYAREKRRPYLGLCLGMQLAVVEYARNVLGLAEAHSTEFAPDTPHPLVHLLGDQDADGNLGGTLRLGSYPCRLAEGSKAFALYGQADIAERHRHRFEVNNAYRDRLTAGGLNLVGLSPDGRIVEMIELPEHPFFIATQAHPEFKSRPIRAHPLFAGLVRAAL
jgi:CTP synthase